MSDEEKIVEWDREQNGGGSTSGHFIWCTAIPNQQKDV